MKKTLIALAVAGTFAAPAFAATSNVDVYGKVRVSVDNITAGNTAAGGNNDGWQIADRVSRIGFKGSEDLGGGLKALWQIEQQITLDAGGTLGGAGLRNTFVGVNGGFGTVIVGRHDTPYKLAGSADLFADTIADSQASGTGIIGRNGFDTRAANTVAYVSPTFSGFHFAAAVVPGEENIAGAGAAAGFGNDARGLMDAYSLAGIYSNGPLNVSVAYENYDKDTNTVVGGAAATDSDMNAVKFNVGYTMGDIKLGYTYERSDDQYANTAANPQSTDKAHLLSAAYGMGPITLMAQYGRFNDSANGATQAANDLTRWVLGANYSLSKRTSAYVAYMNDNYKLANESSQNATAAVRDTKGLTIGLNHDF